VDRFPGGWPSRWGLRALTLMRQHAQLELRREDLRQDIAVIRMSIT
jgi:hypothetical protein